jgi:hypothetical protein
MRLASRRSGMTQSTQYSKGTVLTCAHEGCGCRVCIDKECQCPSGERVYTCACGAPLIELTEDTSTPAGTA